MDKRNCIKCGTEIKVINYGSDSHIDNPESAMWNGGIVDKVTAGFGSNKDMEQFIVAICDRCIEHPSVQKVDRVKIRTK